MKKNCLLILSLACIAATALAISNQKILSNTDSQEDPKNNQMDEINNIDDNSGNYDVIKRFVSSSIMIILGSLICFFGLRFVRFFIYFIVFFLGFGFTLFIVSFFDITGGYTASLVWLIVACCVGLTSSILLCFFPGLWEHFLGVGLGWQFGCFVVWLVGAFTSVAWWVGLLIVIGCMFVGWFMSKNWIDYYVIYSTALNGSITSVVGFGILIGLVDVKSIVGEMSTVCGVIGALLICGLFGIGVWYQMIKFKENQEKHSIDGKFGKKPVETKEEDQYLVQNLNEAGNTVNKKFDDNIESINV